MLEPLLSLPEIFVQSNLTRDMPKKSFEFCVSRESRAMADLGSLLYLFFMFDLIFDDSS